MIADAPLTASPPVALTPNTGVLLSNAVVAKFTDANPTSTVDDFTATIDWGDGTPTTLGTIVQPGGVGTVYDVEGTHAYAKPGTYATMVVVTDVGGSTVSIPGTATVTDPALTGTAFSFTAQEDLNTGTILLATIDNPNTLAGVSQLTATVNWGDGTGNFVVPVVLAGGTPTDSIFQINSSHTYVEEGSYPVTVLVTTTGGATTAPTSPLTATATVVDAPLVAVGSESISGVEGITTGPKLVATWTDTNNAATVADYTTGGGSVVVNWGDGTAPVTLPASAITASGSPNGVVFSATCGAHVRRGGQLPDHDDDRRRRRFDGRRSRLRGHRRRPAHGAPTFEATTDINPTTAAVDNGVITETLPFTTVVATFTDANPMAPISDYNYVTINWGDGSPAIRGHHHPARRGGHDLRGSGHPHLHRATLPGNGGSLDFPTTVNVHDMGGSTLAINNSVTVAEVDVRHQRPAQPGQRQRRVEHRCDHERDSAEFLRHRHLHPPQRPGCARARCRNHVVRDAGPGHARLSDLDRPGRGEQRRHLEHHFHRPTGPGQVRHPGECGQRGRRTSGPRSRSCPTPPRAC